jgi:hypothetical protein
MCNQEREGYDAAAMGKPCDKSKGYLWISGWLAFHADMDRSESVRFV